MNALELEINKIVIDGVENQSQKPGLKFSIFRSVEVSIAVSLSLLKFSKAHGSRCTISYP